MQVELHVQPGVVADRAAMIDFARRVVPLEHPALVKILDVCLDDAGVRCWSRPQPLDRAGSWAGSPHSSSIPRRPARSGCPWRKRSITFTVCSSEAACLSVGTNRCEQSEREMRAGNWP